MVYTKKVWVANEIIEVSELNNIEQGISDAHDSIESINVTLESIPNTTGYMSKSTYDPDEDGKVNKSITADKLDDGSAGKTYTNIATKIATDIATHAANPAAHGTPYTDAMAKSAINADTSHGTSASHNYRTNEEIQDIVAALLVQGSNITLTYNDTANTLTIASSGMSTSDKSKLDGIEAGATADMTAAEIVALINASSSKIDADNVNVTSGTGLTQDQLTKFNSIEYGATADMTGTEIVTAINASSSRINSVNLQQTNLATILEKGFIGDVVDGDVLRFYIPKTGTIQSVTIISATQPYTSSLMVDIRKNGLATTNSIFTSDSPIVISTSATVSNGIYKATGSLDSSQISLVAGDVLRAVIVQGGNVADLSVCLEVVF